MLDRVDFRKVQSAHRIQRLVKTGPGVMIELVKLIKDNSQATLQNIRENVIAASSKWMVGALEENSAQKVIEFVIQGVYDTTKPRTMRQWWHDRRNPVEWATFWVAVVIFVLTVIFGVISSVTGIMQVYASFKESTI